jgi:hypothetical protein
VAVHTLKSPKVAALAPGSIEASADQLDDELSLDFAPQGFRCWMVSPITPAETAQ